MSGIDSFIGLDQNDGAMSPEAYEAFREQMRKNAAQIAAMQKGEQKQKKKEDDLVSILLKFIRTGSKKNILILIAKLLAENIPAAVILSIISLDNLDVQKEINVSYTLPEGKNPPQSVNTGIQSQNGNFGALDPNNSHLSASQTEAYNNYQNTQDAVNKRALAAFSQDSLPLKVKIALDLWFQTINDAMINYPHKTIKTVLEPTEIGENKPKLIVVQLAAYILRDYLEGMSLKDVNVENLRKFIKISLSEMLENLKNDIENRKLLN
ncbi:hypothetical protein KKG71_06925 [Patescibacteria group bacterium]|nr:hypothetical protein [Patescibacteria group bacterium]